MSTLCPGSSKTNPDCLNRERFPVDQQEPCTCEDLRPVLVGEWSDCILQDNTQVVIQFWIILAFPVTGLDVIPSSFSSMFPSGPVLVEGMFRPLLVGQHDNFFTSIIPQNIYILHRYTQCIVLGLYRESTCYRRLRRCSSTTRARPESSKASSLHSAYDSGISSYHRIWMR